MVVCIINIFYGWPRQRQSSQGVEIEEFMTSDADNVYNFYCVIKQQMSRDDPDRLHRYW